MRRISKTKRIATRRKSAALESEGYAKLPRRKVSILERLLGAIFVLVGSAFWWVAFWQPIVTTWNSMDWLPAQCHIEKCEIKTSKHKNGSVHRVDIAYSYRVSNKTYRSKRYDFSNDTTWSRKHCKEIINSIRSEQTSTCFYDPESPESSVFVRDFENSIIGSIFLPLIIVGGCILANRWPIHLPHSNRGWSPK